MTDDKENKLDLDEMLDGKFLDYLINTHPHSKKVICTSCTIREVCTKHCDNFKTNLINHLRNSCTNKGASYESWVRYYSS